MKLNAKKIQGLSREKAIQILEAICEHHIEANVHGIESRDVIVDELAMLIHDFKLLIP